MALEQPSNLKASPKLFTSFLYKYKDDKVGKVAQTDEFWIDVRSIIMSEIKSKEPSIAKQLSDKFKEYI